MFDHFVAIFTFLVMFVWNLSPWVLTLLAGYVIGVLHVAHYDTEPTHSNAE